MEGLAARPVRWTWLLDNKWPGGSLYKAVAAAEAGDSAGGAARADAAPTFRWSPSFIDLLKVLEDSPEGNDGKAIRDGCTSVTPLRANFESVWGRGTAFEGEFKL